MFTDGRFACLKRRSALCRGTERALAACGPRESVSSVGVFTVAENCKSHSQLTGCPETGC